MASSSAAGPSTSTPSQSQPMDERPSKSRRIERGKKACMPVSRGARRRAERLLHRPTLADTQCRSRKCKCGGVPPDPCPNCVGDAITCQWPTEDGRSSQARKDRARARRLQSMAVRGLGRPPSKADREAMGQWAAAPASEAGPPSAGPSSAGPSLAGGVGGFGQDDGAVSDFALPSLDPAIFDPEQFILAMSSQLPTVEEGSEASPTVPFPSTSRPATSDEGRVVKITWWRPHGPTAIAPGLKRLSLKVRVEPQRPTYPSPSPSGLIGEDLFRADGMPAAPVMRHLLDIFAERFGAQFPVLDQASLLKDLEAGTGSVFLFNCIAATTARFTTHPAIAREELKPHEYGNVFAKRAKEMLASMLAVPSRDTVVALVLMAHVGFGNGECKRRRLG